ncbi:MFS transporter [Kribbella sp. NPDC059898]|uniref:MFS transporter n=1 Tax=Kribbella sp. NPDC059898 TaxID=3346995 RepID=UPI00365547D5
MYLASVGPLRTPLRRVPGNVVALGIVSLVTDVSAEMVTAILPLYLVFGLGLNPLQFGLLDGLYAGATAVLRLAGGHVADRWRRLKTVAGVGYALSAISKLGFLAAGSTVPAIGAVLAVDRAGKGIRTAPRDALISLSSDPATLGRSFGVHRALDTIGAFLGPLVATLVLWTSLNNYNAVFVTSFSLATCAVLILTTFVRDHPHPNPTPLQPDRHPNPTAVQADRRPDSSAVQADRRPDSSAVQADRRPDSSAVQADRRPDSSAVRADRRPDPAAAQADHRPNPTVVQADRRPDPAVVQADRRPDPAAQADRRPDSAVVQAGRRPDPAAAQADCLLDPTSAAGEPEPGLVAGRCGEVGKGSVLGLLRDVDFRRCCIWAAGLGLFTITDSFVYLAVQRRWDIGTNLFPLLPLGTAGTFLLLAIPLGRLGDRVGRWKVFLGGHLALIVALLLVCGPAGTWWLVLALHGAFYAATDGVLPAAVGPLLPENLRASGLAVLQTGQALARMAAAVGVGLLWTLWDLRPALLAITVALLAVTIAAAIFKPLEVRR